MYHVRFPWYDLEEDKETGTVLYRHDSETTFTPEELLGMILNHSRIIAEKFAGEFRWGAGLKTVFLAYETASFMKLFLKLYV